MSTQHDMNTQRVRQELAEYVREITDNGREIAEFLQSVIDGEIEGCELADRVEAAWMLAELGETFEDLNWPPAPATE